MGLLGFLRKREPQVRLKLDEVEKWLRSHEESVGLDQHFASFVAEMKQHVKHALERLDILASAELSNENIPPRAKQIMEGHRKQYIKRVTDFVQALEIPREPAELSTFAVSFSEQVEKLTLDTQKNLFVLKEFLEKEAGAVAKVIGQMDKSITSLRSTYNRLGKEKVDEAYQLLREYRHLTEKRAQLELALVEEREKEREPRQKIEKIEKKIEDYKSSSGYRFIQGADQELKELKTRLQERVGNVNATASPLARPLRKYAKESPEHELIGGYLADWAEALLGDEELSIRILLEKLDGQLGKLDLKEQQEEKARKTIAKMTLPWLEEQRKDLRELKDQVQALEDRLRRDTTMMLINEQERWKASAQEQLDELEKNTTMIENELERLSPRLALQRIRDSLRELHKNVDLEELR